MRCYSCCGLSQYGLPVTSPGTAPDRLRPRALSTPTDNHGLHQRHNSSSLHRKTTLLPRNRLRFCLPGPASARVSVPSRRADASTPPACPRGAPRPPYDPSMLPHYIHAEIIRGGDTAGAASRSTWGNAMASGPHRKYGIARQREAHAQRQRAMSRLHHRCGSDRSR